MGNLTSLDLLNQKFDTISKYINKDQKILTVFDTKEKNLRHYELNIKKIAGKKSEELGEIIMLHDITLYQNAMNRIVKNSRIDKLTGIFNRDYYEKYIHETNFENKTPLCYVAIDLNNLKFINDNYGHSKGDEYICYVSQRLLYIVNKYKGLLFRIGGDEFALIFKNTDDNRSNIITNDIDDLFSDCDKDYPISIALGYAILKNESSQIKDIIIEADNNMYKNKLNSNKSTNNPLISLLRKVSRIHKYETDAHCQRVQNLCLSIGDNLTLDKNTLDDLSLLAQIHDIGKIGISDKILNKTDTLTIEEFEIMKTHTVLGYNIIKSFNHLNTVALGILHHHEYYNGTGYPIGILHHHEYYNGTGYPKGLKGENIPLIARILAVVDAYDAMTNDRVYRKALSEEVAVNELINKKEIQFDPNIVDLFVRLKYQSNLTKNKYST
ncbi:MAG: HD domain-containing phosphohydrolase [Eubacteriaceae bacterium]